MYILTSPPPGLCLRLAVDPTFEVTFLVLGEGVDLDRGVEDLLLVAENTQNNILLIHRIKLFH